MFTITFAKFSILAILLISQSNACSISLRSLSSLSSSSEGKWKSSLTEKQRLEYEEMIALKDSFAASLSFLPSAFGPEDPNYWRSLRKIVITFAAISAFPILFIIFYLVVRFILKKCRGPTKVSQVTRNYRNCTWIIVGVGVLSFLSVHTTILVYSVMAK